jgi:hypothetical protein
MTIRPIGLALGLVCVWASGLVRGAESGTEQVRLLGWAQPAVLMPHHGPGREAFELTARAQWRRPSSGRHALRVVLPSGTVEIQLLRIEAGATPRRLTVYVPAAAVRNLRPDRVAVQVSVVDAATNAEISNRLSALIDDFPAPRPEGSEIDPGPFGWGPPLSGPDGQARLLRQPGPDGWRFVRVPAQGDQPGFFIATSEANNAQLIRRLPSYNPRSGRSDEFILEDPLQPATGLTPRQALAYLKGLSEGDESGIAYRLPSAQEWLRAARAGRSTGFWWGSEPTHPEGANFLGPEPALGSDTIAKSLPDGEESAYRPNPWGLYHTFGNVAEWATAPSGGFVRLGGHFRTEPESPLPEIPVAKDDTTGPDPYVGVRPAFALTESSGAELVRRALGGDPQLAKLEVSFDPDRALATIRGSLPESRLRRLVDERVAELWFLSALDNAIETPTFAPGQLARLGGVAGPVQRITPLGRWMYEVPLEVRWASPLPVSGSEWWVNIYLPGGGHLSHRMLEVEPDRAKRLLVLVERDRMAAAGLKVDAPISVALSLGGEAASPSDPRVVSNVVAVKWRVP